MTIEHRIQAAERSAALRDVYLRWDEAATLGRPSTPKLLNLRLLAETDVRAAKEPQTVLGDLLGIHPDSLQTDTGKKLVARLREALRALDRAHSATGESRPFLY